MNWPALIATIIGYGVWAVLIERACKLLNPGSAQLAYSVCNIVVTCLAVAILHRVDKPIAWNTVGVLWSGAAAVVGVGCGLCAATVFQKTSNPGLVNALMHTCPVVTLLLTMLFLGETITLQAGLGVALVVVGFAMIAL